MTGTIKRLVRSKGYGFIHNGSDLEYFFHRSAAAWDWPTLHEGDTVTFEPVPKEQCPKGPRAQAVKLWTPTT